MSNIPGMQARSALAAIIIALGLSIVSTSASAVKFGSDVVVRYDDLDLSTARGAKVLSDRIRLAAESVCAPIDHGDLSSVMRRKACVQLLVEAVLARMGDHERGLPGGPQSPK